MRASLKAASDAIEQEAFAAARHCAEGLFFANGGIADGQLRLEELIRDLGPRRAAQLSIRFVELKRELRRAYLLRPHLAAEHVELMRSLLRAGWIRMGRG